jgi:hypothetical protein
VGRAPRDGYVSNMFPVGARCCGRRSSCLRTACPPSAPQQASTSRRTACRRCTGTRSTWAAVRRPRLVLAFLTARRVAGRGVAEAGAVIVGLGTLRGLPGLVRALRPRDLRLRGGAAGLRLLTAGSAAAPALGAAGPAGRARRFGAGGRGCSSCCRFSTCFGRAEGRPKASVVICSPWSHPPWRYSCPSSRSGAVCTRRSWFRRVGISSTGAAGARLVPALHRGFSTGHLSTSCAVPGGWCCSCAVARGSRPRRGVLLQLPRQRVRLVGDGVRRPADDRLPWLQRCSPHCSGSRCGGLGRGAWGRGRLALCCSWSLLPGGPPFRGPPAARSMSPRELRHATVVVLRADGDGA